MDDSGDVEPITMCMHKPLLSPIDYSDAFILALAVSLDSTKPNDPVPQPLFQLSHPISQPRFLDPHRKEDILRYSPPPPHRTTPRL